MLPHNKINTTPIYFKEDNVMNRLHAISLALLLAPVANFHAMENNQLSHDLDVLEGQNNDSGDDNNLEIGKSINPFDLSQYEEGTAEHFSKTNELTRIALQETYNYYRICIENQSQLYQLSQNESLNQNENIVTLFKTRKNNLNQYTQILSDFYSPKKIKKYRNSVQFKLLHNKTNEIQGEFANLHYNYPVLEANDISLAKDVNCLHSLVNPEEPDYSVW